MPMFGKRQHGDATWHSRLTGLAFGLLLLMIAVAFVESLQKWSAKTPFDYDAKAFYLPLAKRLLAEGPPFLLTEAAVQVPPLSYVFPALFGADLVLQKKISIGLATLVIFLLFRAGWVLHSRVAGLAAASLYAGSRLFKAFLPTAGVEPMFIFLTAVWLWGMAEGWSRSRRWPFLVAGVAIGMAALTRATIVYFLPLMIIAAWWLGQRSLDDRERWRGMLIGHLLACALVLPVLAKNLVLFGLPSVSTGAGIALFFGSSPLTWGFDQNYFTVGLDIVAIIPPGASHLEVASDRRLMAVAKHMLLTQDPLLTAKMCLLKLHAFLLLSDREWFGVVSEFRNTRILLFALCWPLLLRVRSYPVAGVVAALLAYQVIVHVPVLYAMRYSVVAIDLGLAFLAGLGLAELLVRRRWLGLAATLLAAWLMSLILNRGADEPPYPELNLQAVESRSVVRWSAHQLRLASTANVRQTAAGEFEVGETGEANIDFDLSAEAGLFKMTSHVVSFDAAILATGRSGGATCSPRVTYYYRKLRQPEFTLERAVLGKWHVDELPHRYFVGGFMNLAIYEPGTFRIQMSCPPGTRIRFSQLEVVEPNTGAIYRDRLFAGRRWTRWPDGF